MLSDPRRARPPVGSGFGTPPTVQSIVATGKAVDELTVGELVALSKQVHANAQ